MEFGGQGLTVWHAIDYGTTQPDTGRLIWVFGSIALIEFGGQGLTVWHAIDYGSQIPGGLSEWLACCTSHITIFLNQLFHHQCFNGTQLFEKLQLCHKRI